MGLLREYMGRLLGIRILRKAAKVKSQEQPLFPQKLYGILYDNMMSTTSKERAMAEIISPPGETAIADEPVLTEHLTTTSSEAATIPQVEGEEELVEEFVIEDFTIDGICGVY